MLSEESTVGLASQSDYYYGVVDDSASRGVCGLCGRELIPGPSINKHHLVPKTYGGSVAVWMHSICHSKIHSLFSERELRDHYNTFEALLDHEDIQSFVRWVRKKDPTFQVRNRPHNRRRR